ncbi:hypothetical protein J4G08_13005 [Candidatus Poribacteria bacterium]|nr:hypothetical protein [Candidatus Poribacteria bacterium]
MRKKMMWTTLLFLMCVAAGHGQYNGECWVVSGGDTVYKLHANGAADPSAIQGLTNASAVQVNPVNGIVWIAVSAGNAVFRYDSATGAFDQTPEIKAPTGISVNPADGTVWVAGLDGVRKISADGKDILAQVIPPDGPANLDSGRFSVAVNPKDGSCWITDGKGPIGRYDSNGNLLASAPPMDEPKGGLSVDYQGNVWIADTQHNRVVRLSPNGEVLVDLTDIPTPVSPSVNPKDGSVWLAGNNNMLINLSSTGTKLKEFEVGLAIVAVTFSPADSGIWIADMLGETFQGQVSKWAADGVRSFANAIPQPSTVSIGFWEGN